MMELLAKQGPVVQSLLLTLFTWGVTALGAGVVFFFKNVNQKIMDIFMGFGAGVMIAASFWSLLSPAIELSEELGFIGWFWPALGFLFGGLFILAADRMLDCYGFAAHQSHENLSLKRSLLLVIAVTMHNIPEGMAVGVAFGGAALGIPGATLTGALLLAVGIGLQNFPEGAAVALPLRREGFSRMRSFWYGQLSGIVEPIAALMGVYMVMAMRPLLPFLLSFAAGAMIGVVTSELIPESVRRSKNLAVLGVVGGFILMMVLDVALS